MTFFTKNYINYVEDDQYDPIDINSFYPSILRSIKVIALLKMEDKPFIDKGDTSAKSKINLKVIVYNFVMDHYNIYDGYKSDPSFKILDTIFGMYPPLPSLKDFDGFQIYRTYAEKSDSSYIIGVFAINLDPYKRVYR